MRIDSIFIAQVKFPASHCALYSFPTKFCSANLCDSRPIQIKPTFVHSGHLTKFNQFFNCLKSLIWNWLKSDFVPSMFDQTPPESHSKNQYREWNSFIFWHQYQLKCFLSYCYQSNCQFHLCIFISRKKERKKASTSDNHPVECLCYMYIAEP